MKDKTLSIALVAMIWMGGSFAIGWRMGQRAVPVCGYVPPTPHPIRETGTVPLSIATTTQGRLLVKCIDGKPIDPEIVIGGTVATVRMTTGD